MSSSDSDLKYMAPVVTGMNKVPDGMSGGVIRCIGLGHPPGRYDASTGARYIYKLERKHQLIVDNNGDVRIARPRPDVHLDVMGVEWRPAVYLDGVKYNEVRNTETELEAKFDLYGSIPPWVAIGEELIYPLNRAEFQYDGPDWTPRTMADITSLHIGLHLVATLAEGIRPEYLWPYFGDKVKPVGFTGRWTL